MSIPFTVQPYLNFNGRCEEALAFYAQAVGAQTVFLKRFTEAPDQAMVVPGTEQKIMHATFTVGGSTLMASDGRCSGAPSFSGITLSLNAADLPDAERAFTALSQDGEVQMPIAKTFWSPGFGMLVDKFGVPWMVSVAG